MKIKVELRYPRNNISHEDMFNSICTLIPEYGATYERRINSILLWHDGEARALFKKPYDFVVHDGQINLNKDDPHEFRFICTRDYPLWPVYVPLIIIILILPMFFFNVVSDASFIRNALIGFIVISIVFAILNYFVFAPYWLRWAMKKLLDEAMSLVLNPNK